MTTFSQNKQTMNANELRIGNWVQNKSEYIRVVDFDSVGVNRRMGGYLDTLDRITPIPLTPEILEKAGFEYEYDQMGVTYRNGQLAMFYDGEGFGRNFGMNAEEERMDVNVKYLHQLQNLYFCLCGEELKIHL